MKVTCRETIRHCSSFTLFLFGSFSFLLPFVTFLFFFSFPFFSFLIYLLHLISSDKYLYLLFVYCKCTQRRITIMVITVVLYDNIFLPPFFARAKVDVSSRSSVRRLYNEVIYFFLPTALFLSLESSSWSFCLTKRTNQRNTEFPRT